MSAFKQPTAHPQVPLTNASDGSIHRLIFVHAEGCHRLLKLFITTPASTTAILAMKGLAMTLSIKFEDGPVQVAEATVEEVADAAYEAAGEVATKKEAPAEVITYDFNGMSLRVVQIDGEPWFVSKDLEDYLGFKKGTMKYHRSNTLNDDEKGVVRLPVLDRRETRPCASCQRAASTS